MKVNAYGCAYLRTHVSMTRVQHAHEGQHGCATMCPPVGRARPPCSLRSRSVRPAPSLFGRCRRCRSSTIVRLVWSTGALSLAHVFWFPCVLASFVRMGDVRARRRCAPPLARASRMLVGCSVARARFAPPPSFAPSRWSGSVVAPLLLRHSGFARGAPSSLRYRSAPPPRPRYVFLRAPRALAPPHSSSLASLAATRCDASFEWVSPRCARAPRAALPVAPCPLRYRSAPPPSFVRAHAPLLSREVYFFCSASKISQKILNNLNGKVSPTPNFVGKFPKSLYQHRKTFDESPTLVRLGNILYLCGRCTMASRVPTHFGSSSIPIQS